MKVTRKQKTKEDLELSKVKVIVRVRPFVGGEVRKKCVHIDQANNEVQLIRDSEVMSYAFDGTYDASTSQEDFFASEVSPIVDSVFKGINTTIFAYGITGAGKTFTMQGGSEESERGIIPRVAEKVMESIASKQHSNNPMRAKPQYSVSLSYLEIYNEKVYDLLRPKDQDLPIREDQEKNIFIPNLAKMSVTSYEQFLETYDLGCKNRTTAPTSLNSSSSRSHAVMIITVKHADNTGGKQRKLTGKLHLIDLAGSEDNRRTDNMGMRMVESTNINRSLFVLGKVVNALNDGSSRIPYRDSKLTRLLQDSLGGRSYGIMIANLSPALAHYQDTYNTLNFAAKSRKIVNKPVVNSVTAAPVIDAAERRAKLLAFSQKKAAATGAKRSSGDGELYSPGDQDKENLGGSGSNRTSLVNITTNRGVRKPPVPLSASKQRSSGSSSNTKPSGKGSAGNVDALIEKKLETKLAQLQAQGYMLGPSLRDKKILREDEQERLENLEKKVMALAMSAAEQTINNCFPEENGEEAEEDENEEREQEEEAEEEEAEEEEEKKQIRGRAKVIISDRKDKKAQGAAPSGVAPKGGALPVGMTPLTSAQAAKSYIKKAKKMQESGKLKEALQLYRKAHELIENPRLSKKIKQLEKQLAKSDDEEDDRGTVREQDEQEEDEEMKDESEKNNNGNKRKSAALEKKHQGRSSYESYQKRRKVKQQEEEEEGEEEEEEKCIIMGRRPRKEDEEDEDADDDGDGDYACEKGYGKESDDEDFVPEKKKKLIQKKASQAYAFSGSPIKAQEDVVRGVLGVLNRGSMKELRALHGIGEKRAESIMSFRANKPFTKLEELRTIGFGEKLFQSFMQRNVYEAC